ncbi:MAG: MFS transporter [Deltaproteobacteria bacterium]|nr:MFS transporter [Deltaproteobacteria bacterium]MBN2845339.1 MFS transporter [Deltaproteobacteria bacterium]
MENKVNADGYLISKRYSYYVFFLLFLLYMFNYVDRMVVVSIFPFLHNEWGISDTKCGLLVSAAYWAILIFSLPFSVLIDRWSRRKAIGIMAVLWSAATALCGATRSFAQLFTARAVIGIGEAGFAPGGTAMISAIFPEEKRAQIMGFWNASIPLGSALGIALGAIIAEHFGWRYAFLAVAIPGLIAGLVFFRIKDYKTVDLSKTIRGADSEDKKKMKMADIVREFTGTPSLILTYLAFAGNLFVTTSLMSWLPTYFHRSGEISMSKAGMMTGAVMALAIVGAPLGGVIADRWQRKRGNARLLFSSLSSTLTALIFFIAFAFFTGKLQYMLFLCGGISAVAFVPAAAAVTQDVVHPGLRAISYSLCVIVQHILGSSIGPVFVGAVSDRHDIGTALTIVPLFSLIAGLFFFAGSFFYMRDKEKVEKVAITIEE